MLPDFVTSRLTPQQRELLGQLVRYGVSGLFVTGFHQCIYLGLAQFGTLAPQFANILATIAATIVGYTIHSQWSFKGHGGTDGHARMGLRFAIVTAFGFALNSLWIWIFHDLMGGAAWWPSPAMAVLTPLAVFWLNRRWVFA